jgi:hypothetical protein
VDADPRTGQRRWTGQQFLYTDHTSAELGYAVTDHVAQSRTVTAGLAVIVGTEDRQHACVALTRGADTNMAYVFTLSPNVPTQHRARAQPPSWPRYDRITAAHDGEPAIAATQTRDALSVLAGVLERDGQQHSASQTCQHAQDQARAAPATSTAPGVTASGVTASASRATLRPWSSSRFRSAGRSM